MPVRTPQDPKPAAAVVSDSNAGFLAVYDRAADEFSPAERPAESSSSGFAGTPADRLGLRFTAADVEAAAPVTAVGRLEPDGGVLIVSGQTATPVRISLDAAGRPTVRAGGVIAVSGITRGIDRVDISGLIDSAVEVVWTDAAEPGCLKLI